MVVRLSTSDRRKGLRALTQRGFVVHVGALEALYLAYASFGQGSFSEFLDKTVDLLGRPNIAKDGIITKDLASSIGDRIQRDSARKVGIGGASIEVIDAFSVPKWHPDSIGSSSLQSTGTKIYMPTSPIIDSPSAAKSAMFKLRYELLLSKTLRNPRFKPPSNNSVTLGKNSPYFELTGIESLAGSKGEKFVLAMLAQLEDGNWYMEDINGTVKVDLSEASITAGLHTESSFVIAQGVLVEEEGEDPIFRVSAMGSPPFEKRDDSLIALGKDANVFGGHFDPSETVDLLQMEEDTEGAGFMLVADVALDNSRVMAGLRHVFRGYVEDNFIPTVIILMGNFLSHPFGQELDDVMTLQEKFGELGEMIKNDFEPLAETSTFVIVPGSNDPGPGNVLPRPPMPQMITRRFVQSLGSEKVHLTTNPCRIRYLTQEIVIFRDDIMHKMVRHCSVKPDAGEKGSMSEHVVKSLLDQAYLSPLPLSSRPVLWSHDHALWLFPTPHTVVLGDRAESYICEYEGSLGLNPGSFAADFSFQIYLPAQKRAQQCSIDSEDVRGTSSKSQQQTESESRLEITNPPMVGQPIDSEDEREGDEHDRDHGDASSDHTEEDKHLDEELVDSSDNEDADMEDDETGIVRDPDERDASGIIAFDSAGRRDAEINEASIDRADDIESDDDSLLVPAEGIRRLDIKAMIRDSFAADESHPLPDSGSEDDA